MSKGLVCDLSRLNGRHGPGPFVTEIKSAPFMEHYHEPHNRMNRWQGGFRVGYIDLVALPYGMHVVGGVDEVMLTWCDKLDGYSEARAKRMTLSRESPL